jgi:hypothetical protein
MKKKIWSNIEHVEKKIWLSTTTQFLILGWKPYPPPLPPPLFSHQMVGPTLFVHSGINRLIEKLEKRRNSKDS